MMAAGAGRVRRATGARRSEVRLLFIREGELGCVSFNGRR